MLGELLDRTVTGCLGAIPNPELEAYVQGVGNRLAEHSSLDGWTFRLLPEHRPLAFDLPGRYVHVALGLVVRLNSEAELAAVLAHEMGHELEGHLDERLVELVTLGRAAPHRLDDEVTADRRAVRLLRRSGYDPAALSTVLRALARYRAADVAALHERASIVDGMIAGQDEPSSDDGRARYLRALDGTVLSEPGPSIALPSGWGTEPLAASPCEPIALNSPDGNRMVISAHQTEAPEDLGRRVLAPAAPEGFELYVRSELQHERLVVIAAMRREASSSWREFRYWGPSGATEDDAIRLFRSMVGDQATGQRIRMVRAEPNETLRAVRDRACPDAPLGLVVSLTEVGADAVIGSEIAVRCVERWGADERDRK
ncbi:MAG: hypothetical protein DRJ42_04910 [Deltaproteobacteria bacterium]|nr:MAG: hypothetical protein DRJ42_04910 [Deltaproteobacteria bacterium]